MTAWSAFHSSTSNSAVLACRHSRSRAAASKVTLSLAARLQAMQSPHALPVSADAEGLPIGGETARPREVAGATVH